MCVNDIGMVPVCARKTRHGDFERTDTIDLRINRGTGFRLSLNRYRDSACEHPVKNESINLLHSTEESISKKRQTEILPRWKESGSYQHAVNDIHRMVDHPFLTCANGYRNIHRTEHGCITSRGDIRTGTSSLPQCDSQDTPG
jgi:hypothetical protein